MIPLGVGDHVEKPRGYKFPGVVRSVFTTAAGYVRVVVEMNGDSGLLHIFSLDQVQQVPPP